MLRAKVEGQAGIRYPHALAAVALVLPQQFQRHELSQHAMSCIAFTAETRAQVVQFYEAALRTGGKDNGEPGLRPHYHENYCGAFVLDPDGNNIEGVCHKLDTDA